MYSHLWDGTASGVYKRGVDYVDFAPDRVACQDATAQMALLQFMHAGKKSVANSYNSALSLTLFLAKDGAKKRLAISQYTIKRSF